MLKRRNSKPQPIQVLGFTLIELLMVISIIGVLSTIAVTSLNGARTRAREAKMLSTLGQMDKAANLDFATYGNWSPDVEPNKCSCSCYSDVSHPRFVTDNIFPVAGYDDAKWFCPNCCYDYQNWENGDWISVDVYSCINGCTVNVIHRKCIYDAPGGDTCTDI